MLLNNFYNLMCMAGAAACATSNTYGQLPDNALVDINGSSNNGYWYGTSGTSPVMEAARSALLMYLADGSYRSPYLYAAVGTASTTVMSEDYTLTDMIISDAQNLRNLLATDSSDAVTCSILVTNGASEDYTAAEVGFIVNTSFAWSESTTSSHSVLVLREVLETPVTIPAGQSAVITFKLRW